MFLTNKTIIPESHCGLLFKNQQFVNILNAGTHRPDKWWSHEHEIRQMKITQPLENPLDEASLHLAELHPDAFEPYILRWRTEEDQVGLIYQAGVLKDIKAPAQYGAYWNHAGKLSVHTVDISTHFKLDNVLARRIQGSNDDMLRRTAAHALVSDTVLEGHVGFLEIDGTPAGIINTGKHTWWGYNRNIAVMQMDLRLQNMEVNGQEILTKDKVSLRINLSATWQVNDAAVVKETLSDHYDYLYRELQLALRTVVSTQTLDELLADKNSLNQQAQEIVATKVSEFGLALMTVGARDIILPGEMKMILAEVVEAEKTAEANLIRRREETQATRSLHNTAKLMEGNPTLLRLKELEVLESITANIHELKVYGGLDGMMNSLVRLGEE